MSRAPGSRASWSPLARAVDDVAALLGGREAAFAAAVDVAAGRPRRSEVVSAFLTAGWTARDPERRWASIQMLVDLHELDARARDGRAAYYTPDRLARVVARETLRPWIGAAEPPRVHDPCCGCGDALVAAARVLIDGGQAPEEVGARMSGTDLDPVALTLARARLQTLTGVTPRLEVADALRSGRPSADAIIGNPPFGNAIERRTGRSAAEHAELRRLFPHAATGAYDRAGVFVERALQDLGAGGRLGLVLPRAVLAAPYAASLRAWIDRTHRLDAIVEIDAVDAFAAAAISVCAIVVEAWRPVSSPAARRVAADGGPERVALVPAPGAWGAAISPYARSAQVPDGWRPLSTWFSITASASAAEAYAIAPHVVEAPSDRREAGGWRLVTTGAIEPLGCRWGTTRTRYLKRDYDRPWLCVEAVPRSRRALYGRPKVLVAGLSRVLEAWTDVGGECAGAVATLAATARTVEDAGAAPLLRRLALWLCSMRARAEFLARHGAHALGGVGVQVTKAKVAELHAPEALFAVAAAGGADAGAARRLVEAACAVASESPLHALPDGARAAFVMDAARRLGGPLDVRTVCGALDRLLSGPWPPRAQLSAGEVLLAALDPSGLDVIPPIASPTARAYGRSSG